LRGYSFKTKSWFDNRGDGGVVVQIDLGVLQCSCDPVLGREFGKRVLRT
jgi:hypothetical protein